MKYQRFLQDYADNFLKCCTFAGSSKKINLKNKIKEQIYQLGKEKFVSNIVTEILKKDKLDDTVLKEIEFDDGGDVIYVRFTGGVSASTFIAIAEAFGDNDPDVYANGENLLEVVFYNKKYDELIG